MILAEFDVILIALWFSAVNNKAMKATSAKRTKGEEALLDHATDQLLRAIKARMRKKDGRVDYARLRKEGYSDRFLARLEEA